MVEKVNSVPDTGTGGYRRKHSDVHKEQLLLPLLSHFSRVRLCATPQTAAHQAPPALGFSRQEHWSGLPCPSPVHESESEVTQSCPTLRDPMDCSPPGSSIHGIFQARGLESGAIAFSDKQQWHLHKQRLPWAEQEDRWRSAWEPLPVLLPGESYRQRSLAGYTP